MNFIKIIKVFIFVFVLFLFSIPSLAQNEAVNSLSKIVIDKPIDNNYQLDLYFKSRFQGNAFLQKRKNGSFFVFIPETVLTSKNVKVIYKDKVNKSDVKLDIKEQSYTKEDGKSKYVKLSVDTPINSDIQLVAHVMSFNELSSENSINKRAVIFSVLFILAGIILFFAFKLRKRIKLNFKSNMNISKNITRENSIKPDIDTKMISPVSSGDFSCFDLPLKKEEEENIIFPYGINKPVSQPIYQAKKHKEPVQAELELDLPSAETLHSTPNKSDEMYRPELISELKIAPDKGFYLTSVGDNSFVLFGYIGEKVFYLQKFNDLTQINLQARLYDKQDGKDLYILRLDSYKSMLSVSDTEIQELSVI